jgi:hypothetical protein
VGEERKKIERYLIEAEREVSEEPEQRGLFYVKFEGHVLTG